MPVSIQNLSRDLDMCGPHSVVAGFDETFTLQGTELLVQRCLEPSLDLGLVKLLKELSSSLKRKIIEKKVNFKKTQIKSGIDVERNLLDIQNATRELKHIQSNFKTDL
jgi:hypothetical protein